MPEPRVIAMARRRDRILEQARAIIAADGYDGLSTRSLAKAAGVTPPTLYNLIGNKQAILRTLLLETVSRVEDRLAEIPRGKAMAYIDAIVEQTAEVVSEDEPYFRAASLAFAELIRGGDTALRDTYVARCVTVAAHACEMAREQGLLRGRLDAGFIARQMYRCFQAGLEEWADGFADLAAFRRHALQGFYCALSPDATDDFSVELFKRLKTLQTESAADAAAREKLA